MRIRSICLGTALAVSASWAAARGQQSIASPRQASDTILASDLKRHIQVLASDEFEGRGPGTRGEDLTVCYIQDQFKTAGLRPGNPDGTYIQQVPLVGIRTKATGAIHVGDKTIDWKVPS